MRLSEWLDRQGQGSVARLRRATGLSFATLKALRENRQAAKYETGVAIVKATRGKVKLHEICELPNGKPRRKLARAS